MMHHMNKYTIGFLIMLPLLLWGCGSNEMMNAENNGTTGGMGMMGDASMHTAHHATLPDEYADLINPVVADQASLDRGGAIYRSSCAVCHGDGGMGDGPAAANLEPAVAAIAQSGQMLSDAYLFWRISEGGQGEPLASAMPAWKETLDEQARWDVINYVHALGSGKVQPMRGMGGMMFDASAEQANRDQMLADAISQALISQADADTFNLVHTALDELMVETNLRMQGNNMPALIAILVDRGTVTQIQADEFERVHDLLIAEGLMHD
jgi:mono/diheme cytochrome c family protein